jgi:hypothetical protein
MGIYYYYITVFIRHSTGVNSNLCLFTQAVHCLKTARDLETKGFWRCRITPRITGSVDCIHRLEFKITRKQRFGNWVYFLLQVSLSHWTECLLFLCKRPNRVGVSILSLKYGNRSSFRSVVFSTYLEFRTMDEVHKPSNQNFTGHLQARCFNISNKKHLRYISVG